MTENSNVVKSYMGFPSAVWDGKEDKQKFKAREIERYWKCDFKVLLTKPYEKTPSQLRAGANWVYKQPKSLIQKMMTKVQAKNSAGSNICLITGNGLLVIDCDDPYTYETLKKDFPLTTHVKTTRGGHLYFYSQDNFAESTDHHIGRSFYKGETGNVKYDVKSQCQYVLAPNSEVIDKETGNVVTYTLENACFPQLLTREQIKEYFGDLVPGINGTIGKVARDMLNGYYDKRYDKKQNAGNDRDLAFISSVLNSSAGKLFNTSRMLTLMKGLDPRKSNIAKFLYDNDTDRAKRHVERLFEVVKSSDNLTEETRENLELIGKNLEVLSGMTCSSVEYSDILLAIHLKAKELGRVEFEMSNRELCEKASLGDVSNGNHLMHCLREAGLIDFTVNGRSVTKIRVVELERKEYKIHSARRNTTSMLPLTKVDCVSLCKLSEHYREMSKFKHDTFERGALGKKAFYVYQACLAEKLTLEQLSEMLGIKIRSVADLVKKMQAVGLLVLENEQVTSVAVDMGSMDNVADSFGKLGKMASRGFKFFKDRVKNKLRQCAYYCYEYGFKLGEWFDTTSEDIKAARILFFGKCA